MYVNSMVQRTNYPIADHIITITYLTDGAWHYEPLPVMGTPAHLMAVRSNTVYCLAYCRLHETYRDQTLASTNWEVRDVHAHRAKRTRIAPAPEMYLVLTDLLMQPPPRMGPPPGAPPRRVARTGGLSQSRTLIAAGSRPFSDLAGWRRTGRPRSSGWPTCATGGGVPRRRARSTRPTRAETVGAEGGARARLADHGSSRSCAPGGGACILRRRRRALRTRASGRRPAPPAVLGRGLAPVPKRGAPNRTSAIRAAHDREMGSYAAAASPCKQI